MGALLDRADLKMALAAVAYYRRAHILSKRPIPPAADRLAAHLEQALSACGQEDVARQSDWLSTEQLAQRLNCSTRTARRIATRIGRRAGRDWLVPADALTQEENGDGVA
ncbi:hypothetical protein [Mycobacterium haemophilum]|uniref:Uncharacterized protein n=1 Tax=Mycobacterium haemophilum TaxID=29311 RepID=A0A0I9U4C4_9MYCO|nr:hypothetical protein [Mycobacterium haemophilum]KLO29522.1 hypothetical protein ABH39_12095 [Mycobacterium haemophilum]KLO35973.1 hypothetical protein ABH38_13935 [Mycobacterium haemophilum]KLO41532.1 hypothetical protein ABH37_13235 [Mycobacterium haemophilum]KLO49411.1 hypothetical protein ABH36_12495 [Mycobacterium haemophilum]